MKYQVGGSLRGDDPTYIVRQADARIYSGLKVGEFCYVLNCRQMGKTSLLHRTKYRLEKEGYICVYLDVTRLGSEETTPMQWYKGIIVSLFYGLNLAERVNFKQWWEQQAELSPIQRLHQFIEQIVLPVVQSERIFIFIDEIDSLLSLSFPVSDFLAWIRHCYNMRAENPDFNRLGFALFGVASPSDLIADKRRTPFNIGTAIELYGFQLHEATPLLAGLEATLKQPAVVLREIIRWTGGQPFLTQKLCQLVQLVCLERSTKTITIPDGAEAYWVEQLVKSRIIQHWQSKDEPEHFRTIRDRLLFNEQRAGRLLAIYQKVLQAEPVASGEGSEDCVAINDDQQPQPVGSFQQVQELVPIDDSREQMELLLSGLVEKRNGYLRIKNPIYLHIFNAEWVVRQLDNLRPYAQAFDAWISSSQQDESRLLCGQALIDAKNWAQGKSLSDYDYQFLAASQNLKWREEQLAIKAERASAIALQLSQQRKYTRQKNLFIAVIVIALIAVTGLSTSLYFNSRTILLNQIKTITTSSQLLFASNQHLDAMIAAINAKRLLQSFGGNPPISSQVDRVLLQAALGADESNRLVGHQGAVKSVAFSPDGQAIASTSSDQTIKLWSRSGKLLQTLVGHKSLVWDVAFSCDGHTIVSGSMDGTVKLWNLNGNLRKHLIAHQGGVLAVSVSNNLIASAGNDKTIKLWTWDGKLLQTLTGHSAPVWDVAISNDEELIISGSEDNTVKLWNRNGTLLATLTEHTNPVRRVAINPQGTVIATASGDNTVKLWNRNGVLLTTLLGHTNEVWGVAFSPDGQMVATAGNDLAIKLWQLDGTLLTTFRGHSDWPNDIKFSPDGSLIASAGQDKTVKLWQWKTPLLTSFSGQGTVVMEAVFSSDGQMIASAHEDGSVDLWNSKGQMIKRLKNPGAIAWAVAFSPDSKLIASASSDANIRQWNSRGILLRTLKGHQAEVWGVAFSPDGSTIASSSMDSTVNLWSVNDGRLYRTLKGHTSRVKGIAFSPDGKLIASASEDGTVKLWNVSNGKLINTLKGHHSSVWGVAFSPDGKLIASAGEDKTVKLWNSINGLLVRTLNGHSGTVWSVAFSPDSQLIASGSADRTVKLWRTNNGSYVTTLYRHSDKVNSVMFSPNGQAIASASSDSAIIIWNFQQILALDSLVYSCNWVRDYLQTNLEVENSDRNYLCP